MKLKVVLRKGEDGWYVVEVPSLHGCISQGKTVKEALENIKEAVTLYLESEENTASINSGRVVEVTV